MKPTIPLPSTSGPGEPPVIPLLEPGDRLSRAEFERRYEAMPWLKKAELIEGVVYMPASVRLRKHGNPNARLVAWLVNYESCTPGLIAGDNTSARLDLDNMPQPDGLLMIEPKCGGQARISDDDYIELGPELVGEVSSSTASFDLHTKLNVYRRNGVREYLVWRVLDKAFDWFVLREGEFIRHPPEADGVLRSTVFPGLWLHVTALLAGNMALVLETLLQGTSTAEHAEFVRTLAARL